MIRRETAAGNHAVQMRMMQQILPPGMQDGEETDLRSQMFRIAGNGQQGFRGGAEQNAVDRLFVIEGDLARSVPAA